MHENHLYNLMCQLVQEDKSLWRINHAYVKDAKNCKECKAFWAKMKKDKEGHIKELSALIKKHIK